MKYQYLKAVILGLIGMYLTVGDRIIFAAPTQPTFIPTVTRLVALFSGLEHQLNTAIIQGDKSVLEKLLADDFEERGGSNPGKPLPHDEWINATLKHQYHAFSAISEMAARDSGNNVIVSFKATTKNGMTKYIFVVDNWKQVNNEWKLAVRYVSQAKSP